MNEKETNHPVHPMDRTANWCSHGGWFTLALTLVPIIMTKMNRWRKVLVQFHYFKVALCFFLQCLLQQEENGGRNGPPLWFFWAKFVVGGGRRRGEDHDVAPYVFFQKSMWRHNGPTLVSLVFLHTFFGLAQLCKKPFNPVFNVLQNLKKVDEHSIILQSHCYMLIFCIASNNGTRLKTFFNHGGLTHHYFRTTGLD